MASRSDLETYANASSTTLEGLTTKLNDFIKTNENCTIVDSHFVSNAEGYHCLYHIRHIDPAIIPKTT
jgi:hypothetical protein